MTDPTIPKKYFLYVGIVLLVLIFFSYANTLNSPFNFDDHAIFQVVNWSPTNKSCGFFPIQYRHLFFQSFCITQSQKGLDPFWYHLVNISLHFLTSLTLFSLLLLTLDNGTHWRGKDAFAIAWLTTILFAINPLNTETVTYISGRASGMAGFFYLLTIFSFTIGSLKRFSGKEIIFYPLAVIFFLAAILSKETSITLPIIIILYDLCFINNNRWSPLKSRLAFLYLPITLSVIALLILQPSLQQMIIKLTEKLDLGYALNQAQVVGYSFKLSFFPMNLLFDYNFPNNWFASDAYKWLPTLFWLSLVTIIIKRFKNLPATIPFSVLWFILTISITNSFLPRADLLSERNLYLPGIGPTLLISSTCYYFLISAKRSLLLKQGLALLIFLLIIQSSLTIKRNSFYKSNITLWEDTLKKSPSDLKVLHNLSHFYLEGKDNQKALVALTKLSRSNASSFYRSFAHSNLGSIHAQNKNFNLAEKEFNKAIRLDETIPLGYLNLGNYYASRGLYKKAKVNLKKAYERYDKYRWGYTMPNSLNFSLGKVNFELKNFFDSIYYLKKFLKAADEPANALLLLGKVFHQMGEIDLSIETYRKIKDAPEIESKAANNLGILYLSLDQSDMALTEFERSLKLNPKLPDSHYNLGKLILDSNGNIESARTHLKAAYSLTQNSLLKTQIKNLLSQISS